MKNSNSLFPDEKIPNWVAEGYVPLTQSEHLQRLKWKSVTDILWPDYFAWINDVKEKMRRWFINVAENHFILEEADRKVKAWDIKLLQSAFYKFLLEILGDKIPA